MIEHVVDLETAKRLKDYLPEGWESEFCHYSTVNCDLEPTWYIGTTYVAGTKRIGNNDRGIFYAPLLSEMLGLMPKKVKSGERFFIESIHELFDIGYKNDFMAPIIAYRYGLPNLATAAAELYMWLVDEGHVEVNDGRN